MIPQAPRRYRIALARVVCIFCSLCGVFLAGLIWRALPLAITSPNPSPLVRVLMETLLVIGFVALAWVGIRVGVILCRLFLSMPEIAKLTRWR